MGFEEVAVKEWDVRGRAAVQGAEVADERMPERAFGGTQAAAAEGRGRFLVEFEWLLVPAPGRARVIVIAPGSD